MPLQCQLNLSYASYQAGQTPAPVLTLVCFNPGAAALVVTGVALSARALDGGNINRTAASLPTPPIGPGQTVLVPALSSITIGPMSVAVASAASANSFQMSPPGAQPSNAQGTQPPQSVIVFGARVEASDGTASDAGVASLLVSFSPPPPQAWQGGYFQFASPNNFVTGLLFGVL